MKALLIILFPSIFVSLASSNLVNAVQQRTSNPIAENPCSSYRVWVLRPILDRFVKVNSSEELKVQVNAMAETIKDLQSQINCKEEQLVEKTKEISACSRFSRCLLKIPCRRFPLLLYSLVSLISPKNNSKNLAKEEARASTA